MTAPYIEGESQQIITPRWYAVRLHSNFEALASEVLQRSLQEKGSIFYPWYYVKSIRRGKEHVIRKPLFPGYIFVRVALDYGSKVKILSVRGVVELVKFDGKPATVADEVIDSLMILSRKKEIITPHPYVREGTRVKVIAGPLAGARGIVVGSGKKSKLIVSVDILQRSVGIPIDPLFLELDAC